MAGAAATPWTIVLAAGEGRRLAPVTRTDDGQHIPKQYFRGLYPGETLLQRTLRRMAALSPPDRTLVVVAREHRRWWTQVRGVPRRNLIVQPFDRGTAVGLLLALMRVHRHERDARVVITAADHHVDDELLLIASLRLAAEQADHRQSVLLGVSPDGPGTDYGWIVPGEATAPGLLRVRRFVEKPGPDEERTLRGQGGLWSSFDAAGTLRGLFKLYERSAPWLLHAFRDQARLGRMWQAARLTELYHVVPSLDLSHDVLTGGIDLLKALRVPPCGWCDLGTPERLRGCRARLERRAGPATPVSPVLDTTPQLHLAER